MIRPAPALACGFVRRPARSLPPGDRGGRRPPCAAARHRSNPIGCSSRAGVAGTTAGRPRRQAHPRDAHRDPRAPPRPRAPAHRTAAARPPRSPSLAAAAPGPPRACPGAMPPARAEASPVPGLPAARERGCLGALQRPGCRARRLGRPGAPAPAAAPPGSGWSRRTPRAAAAILGDLERAPRAPPRRVAA
jgi:hypothetical protein